MAAATSLQKRIIIGALSYIIVIMPHSLISPFHPTRYEHTTSFLFSPERLLPLVTRSLKLELSHLSPCGSLALALKLSSTLVSGLSHRLQSRTQSRSRLPCARCRRRQQVPTGPHRRALSRHRLALSRAPSLRSSSPAAEPAGPRAGLLASSLAVSFLPAAVSFFRATISWSPIC
ncbi:uncharacterized protein DS421_14g470280 [Arachis hypogaea]|nr:uncharacterized protein DS421_14g470280 [Arachis hypogaea]